MGVLFPKTYSFKPYSGSTRVKGRLTITYGVESTFVGNVQPMNQFQIESLDIGRKNIGKIKIVTDHNFTISTEGQENTGDIIIYDNNEWEVIGGNNNTGNILSHRKYIAELRLLDEIKDS